MFGTEVLAAIRQLPAYQATPIVILSSAAKEREEARCLQLGANANVEKALNFYVYFDSVKGIGEHWIGSASAPDGSP
jgi:response regulator RpfG family c-di-GMP phosphodiesterase